MKTIAMALLLSCVGCCPDDDDNRKKVQNLLAERRDAERQKERGKEHQRHYDLGRRAFKAGIPSTANPETWQPYRDAWFEGYLEAAEQKQ